METIYRTYLDIPFGRLGLPASDETLISIYWDLAYSQTDEHIHNPAERKLTAEIKDVTENENIVLQQTATQLRGCFTKDRKEFGLLVDPRRIDFKKLAGENLCTVPYDEQTEKVADKKKARSVGSVNNQNPLPTVVPCHRVIDSRGQLAGFAGETDLKQWLLDHETKIDNKHNHD